VEIKLTQAVSACEWRALTQQTRSRNALSP